MQFKNHFFTFYILILFPIIKCDIIPTIGVEMNTAGFHRDIKYIVEFDYLSVGKDCEYYLEQQLPAAVYVSVDQLDDLKRLEKLNATYPKFVDVEIATEKATQFTVLLHGVPKVKDIISLPIHFRYHSPGENRFVNVEISHPHMYMRCRDAELLKDSYNKYCLLGTNFTPSEFPTSGDCNWNILKATIRSKARLVAEIPIGDANSYTLVLYTTIIISWVASIWFYIGSQNAARQIHSEKHTINKLQCS